MGNYRIISGGEMVGGVIGVYSQEVSIGGTSLFSGGENDPVSWAHLDADVLARDFGGRSMPYDVTVSLPAIVFNREEMFAEELGRDCRVDRQRAIIHIVVFDGLESYGRYKEDGDCVIQEYGVFN